MPRRCITFACAIFLMLMISQRSNSQQQGQPLDDSRAAAAEKFAALSEQFIKNSLALSPTNASAAGYHAHLDAKTGKTIALDALLDDFSPQSFETQRDFYADWRERFHRETPPSALDPEDAADWQLIDDQIGLNLLEFDKIQNYRHNPTVVVELIGNALFLPLTQTYAPHDVRIAQVLDRIQQIPRLLEQVKPYLADSDPVWINTAIQENDGNVDLILSSVSKEIAAGSQSQTKYDQVAPAAVDALRSFSTWLLLDFAKRPSQGSWRLGEPLY